MIEPQAARLIARVCDSLEQTVLADMAAPHALRQLKSGLWTLRALAARIDAEPQRIREDIADMEQALVTLGAAACRIAPGMTEAERHIELQAGIEALETAAPRAELRELHLRMLAREHASRSQRAGDPSVKEGPLDSLSA